MLPGGCCPPHAQRGSHSGCSPGGVLTSRVLSPTCSAWISLGLSRKRSYLEGAVPYMFSVDLTWVVIQEVFLPAGCCPPTCFSVDLTRVVVQEGFLPGGCYPLHVQRESHSGCSPGRHSYLQGTVPYMFSVDLTWVVVQEGFLPAGCCPLHVQRGSHLGCNPGSVLTWRVLSPTCSAWISLGL